MLYWTALESTVLDCWTLVSEHVIQFGDVRRAEKDERKRESRGGIEAL